MKILVSTSCTLLLCVGTFPIAVTGLSFAARGGGTTAFVTTPAVSTTMLPMVAAGAGNDGTCSFRKLDESADATPLPFVDPSSLSNGNNDNAHPFIECFVDSVAVVHGVEYSIGSPCDYAVALCYFTADGELLPVGLDDTAMLDEVFPIAAEIVEDEFGEELALVRTPQTLTLVGELELGDGEDDDDEEQYEFDADDMGDEEEEVEILLSFEHDGKEFNLVRLLDPVLLVGKPDPANPQGRVLLSPEESDTVMPLLEEMILDYQEEMDTTNGSS